MTERPDPADQATPERLRPPPAGPLDEHAEEFSAFYRGNLAGLVTFLIWQGARSADAVELAQDAMAQAFRLWAGITSPKAWVRVTASRGYARRLASVPEEPVDGPVEASLLLAPDTDLDAFAGRHQVIAVLGTLPPRQRQVMAWTYDGYSPTEIAVKLGLSPVAVRASLRKARTTLARHLDARAEADPR